jgi:tetratricopeptide (TPR) repeat protein
MKYILLLLFVLPLAILAQTNKERGEQLFKAKKYDQALPYLERVLKDNPNDLESIENIGDIHYFNEEWDAAVASFKELTKLKPAVADYYYKYGGALGMKAKNSNRFAALSLISDVKAAFEKAIALHPKHIDARWALIEVYIQLPGFVGGSEKKAIAYSDELQAFSAVDGYLSRGHIEEHFKRYPSAEKYYKKAIAVGNSLATYQKLANLYKNKLKQPEKAKLVMADFVKNKAL